MEVGRALGHYCSAAAVFRLSAVDRGALAALLHQQQVGEDGDRPRPPRAGPAHDGPAAGREVLEHLACGVSAALWRRYSRVMAALWRHNAGVMAELLRHYGGVRTYRGSSLLVASWATEGGAGCEIGTGLGVEGKRERGLEVERERERKGWG